MAINNVSDYFRSKLSHIWARFDLPGPSIYRASTLSPKRPGKWRVYCISRLFSSYLLWKAPIVDPYKEVRQLQYETLLSEQFTKSVL